MHERRNPPAAWKYFDSAHRRRHNVFPVFRCKCFPLSLISSHWFTPSAARLSSLSSGERSSQCFLAWRRIPKGAVPHFQLVTLAICLVENMIVCGKKGPLQPMARKTRAAHGIIWCLLPLRLHLCIYIPACPDHRFATLEYISSLTYKVWIIQTFTLLFIIASVIHCQKKVLSRWRYWQTHTQTVHDN